MLSENSRAFGVTVVGFGECLMAGVVAGPLAQTFPLWAAWALFALGTLSVVSGGLIFAFGTVGVPLWLRSKRWAKKEHKRIIQDQNDPVHADYAAGTGKYPLVSESRHNAADRYLSELIQIGQLRRPWKRLWPYLILLVIVGLGVTVALLAGRSGIRYASGIAHRFISGLAATY